MLIVTNKIKAVIVLKAMGMPPLRLFPGHNQVDEKDLKKYFVNNEAAQGHKTIGNLVITDRDGLSQDDLEKAKQQKAKNDKLNKANKVIKQQNESLADAQKDSDDKEKTIKKQGVQLEGQAIIIQQLQEAVESLQKAATADPGKEGEAEETEKGKKKK